MENLIITKIVQKIKFEEDWGELEAKNSFQDNHRESYEAQSSFRVKLGSAGKF